MRSYLLVVFILLGSARPLFAQAPALEAHSEQESASPPGYKEAVADGLDEFDRSNYLEARANFLEAHRIWPNARTLRVLGYCEFELKNYPAAIELLEQASASRVRPLTDAMRRDVQDVLERARGYVAPITLLTKPADAQILIDGRDVELDPSHVALLAVGGHGIEVRAPNFHPALRDLQVESRVAQTLQIELTPVVELTPPVNQPLAPEAPRSDAEPLRKKWWLWAGVGGVAAVALITGLAVGLHDPGQQRPTGGSEGTTLTVGGMSVR